MHQTGEPCEMYPYFSPKLCNLPGELLYLRLKTAPDDGVCWHTNRPKDVDFQKMKKRCEKLSFRAKIEKWEQRYGGKQLRRMNKEAQNVKHLKIAVDFLLVPRTEFHGFICDCPYGFWLDRDFTADS